MHVSAFLSNPGWTILLKARPRHEKPSFDYIARFALVCITWKGPAYTLFYGTVNVWWRDSSVGQQLGSFLARPKLLCSLVRKLTVTGYSEDELRTDLFQEIEESPYERTLIRDKVMATGWSADDDEEYDNYDELYEQFRDERLEGCFKRVWTDLGLLTKGEKDISVYWISCVDSLISNTFLCRASKHPEINHTVSPSFGLSWIS